MTGLTHCGTGVMSQESVRRAVLALLLVFAIFPSSAEIVELAAHMVGHGDDGHAGDEHDGAAGEDEHGCSGMFHLCACHMTNASTEQYALSWSVVADPPTKTALMAPSTRAGRLVEPPPQRPPIA